MQIKILQTLLIASALAGASSAQAQAKRELAGAVDPFGGVEDAEVLLSRRSGVNPVLADFSFDTTYHPDGYDRASVGDFEIGRMKKIGSGLGRHVR